MSGKQKTPKPTPKATPKAKATPKETLKPIPESSPVELPNDVLRKIAEESSPDTKRSFKQTSKLFRDSIQLSPTDSRKISKYIMDYIKSDIKTQGTDSYITLKSDRSKQRIASLIDDLVISKKQGDGFNELTISTFERSDPKKFQEVLASIRYKDEDELKNLKLSEIIKKDRVKYVSDFMKHVIQMYDASKGKYKSVTTQNKPEKPNKALIYI